MVRVFVGCVVASGTLALLAPGAALADFYVARCGGELMITQDEPPITQGVFGQFVFVQDGGLMFDTVSVTFTITDRTPDPDDFAATFVFADSMGQTMSGDMAGGRFFAPDGEWTGGGTWAITGGTGPYADLSGGGSFTFATLMAENSAFTSFEGNFVPAPGAAALAAFALAGPLVRRRTR